MNIVSIGDQARSFSLKLASSRLSTTLDVLVQELASGQSADIGKRVNGNTGLLSHIETQMLTNEQILRGLDEAIGSIDITLLTLDQVHSTVSDLAINIINDPVGESVTQLHSKSRHAEDILNLTISRLNRELNGQYLFSGQTTDQRPLSPASNILEHLEQVVTGLASADEVVAAVSSWFDAPPGFGGFLDSAFHGDQLERTAIVSPGEALSYTATAGDPNIRNTLKGLVLTSLVGKGVLADDMAQQRQLLMHGGKILYDSAGGLLDVQAELGYVASYINSKKLEITSHSTEMSFLRENIRQVDEYETALAVNDVRTRMQLVYELVSRLSKLKLMDYIR